MARKNAGIVNQVQAEAPTPMTSLHAPCPCMNVVERSLSYTPVVMMAQALGARTLDTDDKIMACSDQKTADGVY